MSMVEGELEAFLKLALRRERLRPAEGCAFGDLTRSVVSEEKLAELAGVDHDAVAAWLAGERDIGAHIVVQICSALIPLATQQEWTTYSVEQARITIGWDGEEQ